MRDRCSASHQAAHLSYLLVIAQNKPERTSEGLSFQPQKDLNTLFFKCKSTDVNLLGLVCLFVGQNWRLIGQLKDQLKNKGHRESDGLKKPVFLRKMIN